MLVLFDHGTPKGLIRALPGHTVHTAQFRGWDTLSNGALLKVAEEAGFEVIVTTDRRIGDPKFRELEPHWRMTQTAGRTSACGLSRRTLLRAAEL